MSLLVDVRHWVKRRVFPALPVTVQEEIDFRFYLRRLRSGSQVPEREFELLPRCVEPGSVALDVGANLGGYAMALCDIVGPAGEVHAFEPVPRTCRLLARSMTALRRPVTVHAVAVSDRVGEMPFFLPLEGALENFYVGSLLEPQATARRITIPTTTLDAWAERHPRRVSFIKIDVEGAEYSVIAGADALLRRERPIVLCEISEPGVAAGRNVFERMASLDYASFQYEDGALVPRADLSRRSSPNYLFVPVARVGEFRDLIRGDERAAPRASVPSTQPS